jgi:two-component system, chemotaxis family, chemotaxis protein CheY
MPQKTLLIVDDSEFARKQVRDIFDEDYKIIEAESGTEGVQKYKQHKPDLVFLDIVMGEGDRAGIDALRQIKQENQNAKVIMVTSRGEGQIMDECQKLGASDYMIKPIDHLIINAAAQHLK